MPNIRNTHTPKQTDLQPGRTTIAWVGAQDVMSLDLWLGAVDAAREHNANLIYFAAEALHSPIDFEMQTNILYDLIGMDNVDGMMSWTSSVASHLLPEESRQFFERYRPLPMVGFGIAVEGIPCVLLDNYQGMYDAVTHLIEVHGYRRIACIRGPEGHPEAEARYRAYTDALTQHALACDPDLIALGTFEPEWASAAAANAITGWLDKRKIKLDAVVTATDMMACAAVEALQARGLRIPHDVAVVGFDDIPKAQSLTPPLTTVRQPFYEMGRRAADLLFVQIDGETVPERVLIPARLVARQSCGCGDPLLIQAAAGRINVRKHKSSFLLATRRNRICAEMVHAMDPNFSGTAAENMAGWAESLLAAFAVDVAQGSSGAFLSALDEILRQMIAGGGNVAACQSFLSTMRRRILPELDDRDVLARAEDLWQQARIAVGQAAQRVKEYQGFQQTEQANRLREIGARLITTFDVQKLTDILREQLPYLGIGSCYLALYENPQPYTYPQSAPQWSRLILAYNERGRVELEPSGRRFRSRDLIPNGVFPQTTPDSLVLEPLYFQDEQIGFVLFAVGPRDHSIYGALRVEISSALQGALLLQRVQERSDEVARQKYILDTFIANVPDSIYFKDRDSRFIRSNQAHARLFGVTDPAELVGMSDFDLYPHDEVAPRYEQEQEIIRTGQPLLNFEESNVQDSWTLTTKMPLRDEHGDIIGTFGISRDITELKKAQRAVQQAYSEIHALNNQLRQENVRMSAELHVVKQLQQMILPRSSELSDISGLDVVGYMQPSDEVGGDYYDVLLHDDVLHIGIGDVTGHGLESGVIMLMTQAAIRTLIEHGETDPVKFVNTLNRLIYKNIERMGADKNLTFALVQYHQGQLKLVGQHEDLLVIRQGGRIERVNTMNLGFPVGLEPEISQWVKAATITLNAGDGLVLYTDGVTEAENGDRQQYGLERLCAVVSQHWDEPAEAIKQAVVADVMAYIGAHKIYDDITLVVLKQQ